MKTIRNEKGQGIIEYIILVVLVAIGALALMKQTRTQVRHQIEDVKEKIENLSDG